MPNSCIKQEYMKGFDWKYITFKNQLTCLNTWRFRNISMKFYQKIFINNILGHIPPVLATAGKREENPPRQILTPR